MKEKKVEILLREEGEKLRREKDRIRKQEIVEIEALRPLRIEVYRVEEALHLLEVGQAQGSEEFVSARQSLQARIDALEEADEPSDRRSDVERRLDALRREVGELRRELKR